MTDEIVHYRNLNPNPGMRKAGATFELSRNFFPDPFFEGGTVWTPSVSDWAYETLGNGIARFEALTDSPATFNTSFTLGLAGRYTAHAEMWLAEDSPITFLGMRAGGVLVPSDQRAGPDIAEGVRGEWVPYTHSFDVTTDNSNLALYFQIVGPAGSEAFIRNVSVTNTTHVVEAFAGSTPPDDSFSHTWAGTPFDSASIRWAKDVDNVTVSKVLGIEADVYQERGSVLRVESWPKQRPEYVRLFTPIMDIDAGTSAITVLIRKVGDAAPIRSGLYCYQDGTLLGTIGSREGTDFTAQEWRGTFDLLPGTNRVRSYMNDADQGGSMAYFSFGLDQWAMIEGVYEGPYFDGNTPRDETLRYLYSWEGEPNASASKVTTFTPEAIEYTPEPDLIVEVAWTDNYAEPFPEWTDITDYVESFNTKLGRSTELGSIEAGVTNLTLDNSTGAFTPGNVNSPFYPNVKPRRQIRVRVDDGTDGIDTPTLTNLVLNPDLKGDTYNCGFSTVPTAVAPFGGSSYGMDNAGGLHGGIFPGNLGLTAWADTAGTEPFACTPGQYVSARVNMFCGVTISVRAVVHFFDALGVEVSSETVSASVPGTPDTFIFYPIEAKNVVVPAGATGFNVEFKTVGVSGSTFPFMKEPAVYLTDEAQGWAEGVPFFSGSTEATSEDFYVWAGLQNRSPSWKFAQEAVGNGLARGYVERWPVEFSGLTGEVTVPVVDWLAEFGTRDLIRPLEHEYMSRNPADLFKFNDESESGKWASSVNPFTVATPRLVFNPNSFVYTDGREIPHIDGGQDPINPKGLEGESSIRTMDQGIYTQDGIDYPTAVSVDIPIPVIRPAVDSFSFVFLYELFGLLVEDHGSAITLYDSRKTFGQSPLISVWTQENGDTFIGFWPGNGADALVASVGFDTDVTGVPIFGGLSWDCDKKIFRTASNMFIWSIEDQIANVADVVSTMRLDSCQVLGYSDASTYWGTADQGMQYLARFDRALGIDEFRAMREASNGLEGQVASDRITYILDMIGYPGALRRIAPAPSPMQRAGWSTGTDALEWLNSTTDSVMGSFYVDPSGYARFVDRHDRAGAPISHTFEHDKGTGLETGLTFELSEDDIINEATIDNAYGVSTVVRNDASILEFGVKSQSYSLHLLDDNEAVQMGYHIVNRNGEPRIRVRTVSFNPSASAYGLLWDHAKGIRLGQRIHVTGLPDNAPSEEMDFFVESVSHSVERSGDRLRWLVTLELSPGDLRQGWILGDPVYGVLGETTRLLY